MESLTTTIEEETKVRQRMVIRIQTQDTSVLPSSVTGHCLYTGDTGWKSGREERWVESYGSRSGVSGTVITV